MRIDDLNHGSVPPSAEPAQTVSQPSVGNDASGKAPAAGSDQAEVSNLAQSLSAQDTGNIEQLRLQVQSGSYDISAQAVANALIEAHLKE
jgi:anti-sigma28 factor (negative regulator of flagellin synthesis)